MAKEANSPVLVQGCLSPYFASVAGSGAIRAEGRADPLLGMVEPAKAKKACRRATIRPI